MFEEETLMIGQAEIIVRDDEFNAGYIAGYEAFREKLKGLQITDDEIYHFIAQNIYNTTHFCNNNAGFICGWVACLFGISTSHPVKIKA